MKAFVEGHANFDCRAAAHLCPEGKYKLDQAARLASFPVRLGSICFFLPGWIVWFRIYIWKKRHCWNVDIAYAARRWCVLQAARAALVFPCEYNHIVVRSDALKAVKCSVCSGDNDLFIENQSFWLRDRRNKWILPNWSAHAPIDMWQNGVCRPAYVQSCAGACGMLGMPQQCRNAVADWSDGQSLSGYFERINIIIMQNRMKQSRKQLSGKFDGVCVRT